MMKGKLANSVDPDQTVRRRRTRVYIVCIKFADVPKEVGMIIQTMIKLKSTFAIIHIRTLNIEELH